MTRLDRCRCCGMPAPVRGGDDPWARRMDGYCDACASNRCDCYPGECPVRHPWGAVTDTPAAAAERARQAQEFSALVSNERARTKTPYAPDELQALRRMNSLARDVRMLVAALAAAERERDEEA